MTRWPVAFHGVVKLTVCASVPLTYSVSVRATPS